MSYNGWSASTSPHDLGGLDNRAVAGVRMAPGVRSGDVATVLFYVAAQFHARVEPLVSGWCWGYSYRQNRNAANLSCHSSATAVDFNAPRHPNGRRGTFTKAQVAEIRRILAEVGGIVRWGGDFTGTPDEMHFEIVASPATVAMVADRLTRKSPAGSPVTTLPAPAPAPTEEDDLDAHQAQQLTEILGRLQGLTRSIPGGFAVNDETVDAVWRKTQPDGRGIPIIHLQAASEGIAALLTRPGADVDEQALAKALGPLLPQLVSKLSDEDVRRVADAAADVQARRLAS
jgi:hypothetical protein